MKTPHKLTMFAVMRDGGPYMILPDIDRAEAYCGSLSLNGHSKRKWTIRQVEVRFPHETAAEQRKRLNRHVQSVVELNAVLGPR